MRFLDEEAKTDGDGLLRPWLSAGVLVDEEGVETTICRGEWPGEANMSLLLLLYENLEPRYGYVGRNYL